MSTIAEKQAELAALEAAHIANRPASPMTYYHGEPADAETRRYASEVQAIGALRAEITALQAEADGHATQAAADVIAAAALMVDIKAAASSLSVLLGQGRALAKTGGFHAARYRELTGDTTYGTPATDPSTVEFGTILTEVAREADETVYANGAGEVNHVTIKLAIPVLA